MFLKDVQIKEPQYNEYEWDSMVKGGADEHDEETDDEKKKSKSNLTQ